MGISNEGGRALGQSHGRQLLDELAAPPGMVPGDQARSTLGAHATLPGASAMAPQHLALERGAEPGDELVHAHVAPLRQLAKPLMFFVGKADGEGHHGQISFKTRRQVFLDRPIGQAT